MKKSLHYNATIVDVRQIGLSYSNFNLTHSGSSIINLVLPYHGPFTQTKVSNGPVVSEKFFKQ